MYKINEKGLQELQKFNVSKIEERTGVHKVTIYGIKKGNNIKEKKVAYCLTKFINSEKEIADYFDYVERDE